MKKIIRILLIGFFCTLPTLVQAQDERVVEGMITLSDDAFNEISGGGSFTCFVYSFYNREEADAALEVFNKNKKASEVPTSLYMNRKRVELNLIQNGYNPVFPFKINVITDGCILVLVQKEGYETKQGIRVITKNVSSPNFDVVKKKQQASTGDMTRDGIDLTGVDVTAERLKGGIAGKMITLEEDGRLFLKIDSLPHPCRNRANSRVIIQPYWLDGPDMGQDTAFAWADPFVYDCKEYDCTQVRRMDFNKDKNDLLGRYLRPRFFGTRLTYDTIFSSAGKKDSLILKDSIQIYTSLEIKNDTLYFKNYMDTLTGHNPDASYPYPARAIIAVQDYNQQYLLDTIPLDEGERTNYIKFLDFSFEKDLDVNLEDFEERMEIRPMGDSGYVKLNFEVGKAILNPKDTTNTRILAEARGELQEAFRQSSSELRYMRVYGYSSPEGNPQSNEDLARRRADFVKGELMSVIPHKMHRFIRPSVSEILGWDVVADSLERDSLVTIAQQVREIVAKYPNNITSQGQAIARLSSYTTIIKPIYLPKLRTVRYNYTKVENRTMSQNELIQKFDAGEDDEFNRAHYYHLIQYYWEDRKDPETRARLEDIAKRAIVNTRLTKDDVEEGKSLYNEGYWALAANILATSYIERDTFDLNILRPFINRATFSDTLKSKLTGADSIVQKFVDPLRQHEYKYDANNDPIGIIKYTNYPEIIAEQMIMLLMQSDRKNMVELGHLYSMIENAPECNDNPTYRKMLALVNCKRGYYRGDSKEAIRTRAEVSGISTTNSVIMNIAQAHSQGDVIALNTLLDVQFYDLPETSIGWYLKAIIELLRPSPNYSDAAEYLAESFKLDPSKMPVANNDQQLIHNRYKIVSPAFAKWEEMMKKEIHKKSFDRESFEHAGIDSLQIAEWKQQGLLDIKMESYWIVSTNTNHPYYWYERAVAARNSEDENEVISNLEKCVACDPNYLSVINVARFADVEVNASKKAQKLFEMFYFNEMRKRR